MIERVVIVPNKDNEGRSLERERRLFEMFLLTTAGGFTAEQVRGAWIGFDGKVMRDRSTKYVAIVNEDQDRAIEARLPYWREKTRQEALLTTRREVFVEFVAA